MSPIGIFSIISWILLPTVMFGGYFLLHLQVRNTVLTPSKRPISGQATRMPEHYYCSPSSITSTWGNTRQRSCSSGSLAASPWLVS